ncbi:MAG: D-tyrosyl-tRNA(Tyr) deacylase [Treponema sp.]|jgi:D-tyrosyl-tRNA(Tyr) deacylase|nr:D-tyrosyl-tRNA(Tyr) deacylase [Treponema sp.]
MKSVIQRVKNASVTVDGKVTGAIGWGLLVYLGVAEDDCEKDSDWLAEKISNMRIFSDGNGKMNLSLLDIIGSCGGAGEGGGVLAVSQFTLFADARKGRRPFYGSAAAAPEKANALYERFMQKIREHGLDCQAGVFQAHMDVSYTNDGPVTILLDSR